jgi:type I restriction enzyme S subunit
MGMNEIKLPSHWKINQLEDICFKIVDCPHTTPHFCKSGVLVVRNFNIRNGRFATKPAFYTSEEEYLLRITKM